MSTNGHQGTLGTSGPSPHETNAPSQNGERGAVRRWRPVLLTDSGVLDLDFDVDTGRKFDALERIDGLGGGIHDVDEALMNAHLEVLA